LIALDHLLVEVIFEVQIERERISDADPSCHKKDDHEHQRKSGPDYHYLDAIVQNASLDCD
jgi:hypothetical protein